MLQAEHSREITKTGFGASRGSEDSSLVRVAVVEDEAGDFFLLRLLLEKTEGVVRSIKRFDSVDALIDSGDGNFDLVILDRFISHAGLTEGRIRQVKAACPTAGVVMYTSHITPSLRSSAAQEGAFAVVEKGSLGAIEMGVLLKTAALIGTQVTNPF